MRYWRCAAVAVVSGLVAGCAATRNYDGELVATLNQAASGNLDSAVSRLEADNKENKDLLYYVELGILERMRARYDESQKAWTAAQQRINLRQSAADLVRSALIYVVSDKLRT